MLHGPAELLPISSSGHTTAVPWLLGSDYARLDPELRKTLEVALHAGTIAALVLAGEPRKLDRRRWVLIGLASAPAGIAGLILERPIEARLGTPSTLAAGLLVGGLAMALADTTAQERRADEAGAVDALWLGLAQACALIPGVSRNGATLAAARLRRFKRGDAAVLSGQLAFPVITGASLLKARHLAQDRAVADARAPLAAAAATSFASTWLAARLIGPGTSGRRLLPFAAYRIVLAMLILIRRRQGSTARRRPPARV